MPLQFDIEAAREDALQRDQCHLGRLGLTLGEETADRPGGAAGETKQAVIRGLDSGQRNGRLGAGLAIEIGTADQSHQITVAGLALHQEHDAVGLGQVSVWRTAVARAAIRQ